MSKKKKKKFKKILKAQILAQLQQEAKKKEPVIQTSVTSEISKWDIPNDTRDSKKEERPITIDSKENDYIKNNLFKVAWVLGITIVILITLIVINSKTPWLVDFSDTLARFSHIIK